MPLRCLYPACGEVRMNGSAASKITDEARLPKLVSPVIAGTVCEVNCKHTHIVVNSPQMLMKQELLLLAS